MKKKEKKREGYRAGNDKVKDDMLCDAWAKEKHDGYTRFNTWNSKNKKHKAEQQGSQQQQKKK